jgi:hypothetical protein
VQAAIRKLSLDFNWLQTFNRLGKEDNHHAKAQID